jgi:hypothetical protein
MRILLFPAITTVAAILLTGAPGYSQSPGGADPAQRSGGRDCPGAAGTGGGQAGTGVYVDAQTGRVVDPPPSASGLTGGLPEPSIKAAESAPAVEVPAPGGGTMIDMRDAPRHYMTGVIEPSGKASVRCDTDVRQPK